jgi:predicted nucleic acid-binding protein
MIVVADTSPISYLAELDLVHLLPALYQTILLPETVHAELLDDSAPMSVRTWATNIPSWVDLRRNVVPVHSSLDHLDLGERAAIELAIEVKAHVLLADERKARAAATQLFGIAVTGTLGVLRQAHLMGLVDGTVAMQQLTTRTTFHHTPKLVQDFLQSLHRI